MNALLLLTAWLAATPPSVSAEDFPTWFKARVRAESPRVLTQGRVDLDGDGQSDHVVCYVFPDASGPGTSAPVVLVGLATGERFAIAGDGGIPGGLYDCPRLSDGPGPARPAAFALVRSGPTGFTDTVALRFDRAGPLLVRHGTSTRYEDLSEDYERQRRVMRDQSEVYAGTAESPDTYESALLLAVSPEAAPQAPATTWTSWSAKGVKGGAADASAVMTARRAGDTVTVQLQVTDDVDVRAADSTPKGVLSADHVELWWQERQEGALQPVTVQLGIARDKEGKPVSVWFLPPKTSHDAPKVRWSPDNAVEVDVPLAWLSGGWPGSQFYPFTAVFSDSDGNGQKLLVSTTARRPSGTNLGGLVLAVPGQRYPRLTQELQPWTPVKPGSTLRELVHQ